MKYTFLNKTFYAFAKAVILLLFVGCQPDDENLELATFPTTAEIFIDGFSAGLQYDAFGESKVTAFDVDTQNTFEGAASMRFDIPNTSDPQGGFAGGVFSTSSGRDLTGYNVLTFYARASRGETINQIGFGLTFQGETYRTQVSNLQVGTAWQKYYIPIPNAAKLTQERGMLWIAEAADNGEAYQLYIDEVKFENLNTLILEEAGIVEGQDRVFPANLGSTIPVNGSFANYNLPDGLLQRVEAAPGYFDFTSSNTAVATVDEIGVIFVEGSEGFSIVTAMLVDVPAVGSITVGMEPLPPSPNVDDSQALGFTMPIGFESSTVNYAIEGFEGASSAIVTNPNITGINTTNTVLRSEKTQGSQFFAGTLLNLEAPIDFATSEILSIKTLSPKGDIPVRIAIENQAIGGDSQVFVDVNTTAINEWEELLFNFSGQLDPNVSYDRIVIFFEFVTDLAGDGSTYYADDFFVIGSDPINTGENNNGDNLLSNGDFEQGMVDWFGNAFNVQMEGGNSYNFANVVTAGNAFDVNLSQSVTLIEGEIYTLTFDASSDTNRSIIAGIGLNENPFTSVTETINLTPTSQTYTLTLTATGVGSSNGRVLFDMGADTGVVAIDNVILTFGDTGGGGSSGELLGNGDFEQGATVWEGNAFNVQTDGGNSYNFANVATAGNAFDVNLSQRLTIVENETYTLTFEASSDGNRTMVVGIGLFEAPFTAVTETVSLTNTTQTFTLTLTATGFGNSNSRVLFDMGADTGVVVIDNVSLIQN
ncbi:carbohydrate binding domain-containing protein [Dokdonia sp. Hel_I_53]|uniref:carbohydrate binding domain-containing protein n=1 Tax=Dokdonia sp. Hel_I_53 TaxID=1566287 RepID=UPI00119C6B25|nr:carbohydrate binding domain-containing protein [Dokdonia sp. Hel_I_53]TVZ53356.1 carbohydrate binding protein [Dokdonia sp. Hel_I_53]